jgi:hypothetical protein
VALIVQRLPHMTSDAVVNDLSTLRVWFVLGSLHLLHQDLDQVDGFSAQYASEVLHHKWYQLVTSKNIAIVMPVLSSSQEAGGAPDTLKMQSRSLRVSVWLNTWL